MEKIIVDGKQFNQIKLVGDGKLWKKPVLIQLDVKQTLTYGNCPSGTTWNEDAERCL